MRRDGGWVRCVYCSSSYDGRMIVSALDKGAKV